MTLSPNSEHGFIRSHDGLRLFFSCDGPKDAPPLIFSYGLACSKLHWKYQIEHFKKDYRVIYMDFRGHGKSETPKDPKSMTIENLAKDLAVLHEELELPPACMLGHSLGVNIVLDFYKMFPEKVKALVLANGTPKDPFETMFHHNFLQPAVMGALKLYEMAPEMASRFWKWQGTNELNVEIIGRLGFNQKFAKAEDIAEYVRLTSTVDVATFLYLTQDFIAYNATPWLGDVKVPTLIVAGEKDLITPLKNQRILHALIPKSEMLVVDEGSHCPQMEFQDLVNERIEQFLEKRYLKNETAKPIKKAPSVSRRRSPNP
jgi:pimeloyl-ACP methyl ester carboxylesterase